MASTSSSTKRSGPKRLRVEDPSSDFEEIEGSASKKLCIICGSDPNPNIQKDGNYNSVLQMYWNTLGIDVKPESCNKSNLCQRCFDKLVKYYETNDIIVYFENLLKSLYGDLLKKTLKGIAVWEKEGHVLDSVQQKVRESYGTIANYKESDDLKLARLAMDAYKSEVYEIIDSDAEESRKGMKIGMADSVATSEEAGSNATAGPSKNGKANAGKISLKGKASSSANNTTEGEGTDDSDSD